MFDKYLSILADQCKRIFQDMTRVEVLQVTTRRDVRPDEIYAIATTLTYRDMDKDLQGTFTLGFTQKEMAVLVASSISTHSGLGDVNDVDEVASDILGEFINTIMGNTITEWDKLGLRVKFGQPQLLENSSLQEKKLLHTKAFVIILHLKIDFIVFMLTVTQNVVNKLAGKRILVVDDSTIIRNILKKHLTENDALVEFAEDGLMAVKKYKSFHPDLTIMDINMPKLDGLEAILRIRSVDSGARFVILSASSRRDEVVTAKTLNVDTYLIKPFNAETFLSAVTKALDLA